VPCGPLEPDDTTGDARVTSEVTAIPGPPLQTSFRLVLDTASPLVDAIPLGDPACDTTLTDLFGTERGVDGDGDGVGGCDIGAIERPA
jgi:hypothetical protein